MVTLTIRKIFFPIGTVPLTTPITVSLYYKLYYGGSFSLIESSVTLDTFGNVTSSPPPSVSLDPTQKYVIRAVNELCGAIYDQNVIINPYCPDGFTLAMDESFCYMTVEVAATPPSASENTVAKTNGAYTNYGSWLYSSYGITGAGVSSHLSPSNPFWKNDLDNTTDGPLNRAGIWSVTETSNQTVGFSVCITAPQDDTYTVGMGVDNFGTLNLDGTNLVVQDIAALDAQYNSAFPGIGADVTFKIWHMYPVFLSAGSHVVEIIGTNVSGAAAMGCEIYLLTPAQLAAATSYADMGAGLIFSSKDYVGLPVQIGSGGIGYTCPTGYSLRYCQSPIDCVKTITVPILY